MKNTPKNYLIGFVGKYQPAVYSIEAWSFKDGRGGCMKMTYKEAKQQLDELSGEKSTVAIYKLVPVYKRKINN